MSVGGGFLAASDLIPAEVPSEVGEANDEQEHADCKEPHASERRVLRPGPSKQCQTGCCIDETNDRAWRLQIRGLRVPTERATLKPERNSTCCRVDGELHRVKASLLLHVSCYRALSFNNLAQ